MNRARPSSYHGYVTFALDEPSFQRPKKEARRTKDRDFHHFPRVFIGSGRISPPRFPLAFPPARHFSLLLLLLLRPLVGKRVARNQATTRSVFFFFVEIRAARNKRGWFRGFFLFFSFVLRNREGREIRGSWIADRRRLCSTEYSERVRTRRVLVERLRLSLRNDPLLLAGLKLHLPTTRLLYDSSPTYIRLGVRGANRERAQVSLVDDDIAIMGGP